MYVLFYSGLKNVLYISVQTSILLVFLAPHNDSVFCKRNISYVDCLSNITSIDRYKTWYTNLPKIFLKFPVLIYSVIRLKKQASTCFRFNGQCHNLEISLVVLFTSTLIFGQICKIFLCIVFHIWSKSLPEGRTTFINRSLLQTNILNVTKFLLNNTKLIESSIINWLFLPKWILN